MHGHDIGVVVLLEVREQVVLVEIGLVPQPDDGRHAHLRRAAVADDGHAHAAALGRQRGFALDVVGRAERRAEVGRGVVEAVDVGPHDAHAVLARHRQQFVLRLGLAHLGETGRNHDGAGDALLADLLHGAGAEPRRYREDGHVDLAGDVQDALEGLLAQNHVGLGIDRVKLSLVTAVDDVLHHRVADLALAFGGADDGHGPRVHDAIHGGDDFFLAGPEDFLRRGEVDCDQRVHGRGALSAGEHRVKVDLADLGEVGDQLRDVHDDVRQPIAVHGGRAPNAVEHFGSLDAVEHAAGIFRSGRRQPERDVLEHLHQHAAQSKSHKFAENRVRHAAYNDFLCLPRHHLLDLHAVNPGIFAVRAGTGDNGFVGCRSRVTVGHPDNHTSDLGLVENVRRDDLHHHRIADPVGYCSSLVRRPGEPLAGQGNPVGVADSLALGRGQGSKPVGPGLVQNTEDGLSPIRHGFSLSNYLPLVNCESPSPHWLTGARRRANRTKARMRHGRTARTHRVNAPAALRSSISSPP